MAAKSLGEILIEQGVINREELEKALKLQGRRLGEILVAENLADPVVIATALKEQALNAFDAERSTYLSIPAAALETLLLEFENLEEVLPKIPKIHAARQQLEDLLLGSLDSCLERSRLLALQTARDLGKEINCHCTGAGLLVDRALAEELPELILHLIRNAVDHGIETPERRKAAGKPPQGTIHIDLALGSGGISVAISDDGQGINMNAVHAKAKSLNLISKPRNETTAEELYRVLFTPGFTTTTAATSISGRGIGLDVVEAGAMRLKGSVTVESRQGLGTMFRIKAPARCARLRLLPLRTGTEWIAVSAGDVLKVEPFSGPKTAVMRDARALFAPTAEKNAAESEARFLVQFSDQSQWIFDEALVPEYVFIREIGEKTDLGINRGVIAHARLANIDHPVLVLNLTALSPL